MNYIYTISDPETNIIKYVGKTNNIKRRYKRHLCRFSLLNENTLKSKWILSLIDKGIEPIFEILDSGDDLIINDLESYWISQLKSWGFTLLNMTNGGDGFRGNNTSQKRSEYSRFLIKMNNRKRKDIIQFDMNNNFIDYFLSAHDVEKNTGFHRSHIIGCCKGKKGYDTCHGYYFRYVDNYFLCKKSNIEPDILKINTIIENIKSKRYIPLKKQKKSIKSRLLLKVVEYDKNGIIINIYESVKIASLKTNISVGLISHCCRNKNHTTAKNRIFRYEKDGFDWKPYDNFIRNGINKKICQYTIDGKLINIFESIKRAAIYMSCDSSEISRCCKNKFKKNGNFIIVRGYTWRLYDETKGENLELI